MVYLMILVFHHYWLFAEVLEGDTIHPLVVLPPNKALVLKAVRDFGDNSAGDEWLFEGPGTPNPNHKIP